MVDAAVNVGLPRLVVVPPGAGTVVDVAPPISTLEPGVDPEGVKPVEGGVMMPVAPFEVPHAAAKQTSDRNAAAVLETARDER